MALATLTLVAALAGAAPSSDPQGSVAVVRVGACSDAGFGAYIRSLRESLSKRLTTAVLSEDVINSRLGGLSRGSLADADRTILAARSDMDASAFERAKQSLLLAADDLLMLPPSPERSEKLRQVLPSLAWVHLKLEDKPAAELTFERILRVEPAFTLDRKQFPSSAQRLLEKIRARVKAQATAQLAIVTRPIGLPVFVDGREIGKGPVSLRVPPGEYRIEAAFGPDRGFPRTRTVETSTSVELDESFEGSIYPFAGPCIEADNERGPKLDALVRLASVLGAQTLVAIRREEQPGGDARLVAVSVDSATGQEIRTARIKLTPTGAPAGALDRVAEFLATGNVVPPIELLGGAVEAPPQVSAELVAPPLLVAPPAVEAAQPPRRSGLRVTSYALGGLAAVALGLGGYFLWEAHSNRNDMVALQDARGEVSAGTEARYRDLAKTRQRNQTIGTATMAGGSAVAIAAVTTFILSRGGQSQAVTLSGAAGRATLAFHF